MNLSIFTRVIQTLKSSQLKEQCKKIAPWLLSLSGNVVAGIVATGLLVWVNMSNLNELKRLELSNSKQTVIWEARVEATRSNMMAIASLNNYIEFEFEKELRTKLKNFEQMNLGSFYVFEGLEQQKAKLNTALSNNNTFLSSQMAEETNRFVVDTNDLVSIQLITFVDERIFNEVKIPIDLIKGVEYSDAVESHIKESVEWLRVNYKAQYRGLENKYRHSLFEGE